MDDVYDLLFVECWVSLKFVVARLLVLIIAFVCVKATSMILNRIGVASYFIFVIAGILGGIIASITDNSGLFLLAILVSISALSRAMLYSIPVNLKMGVILLLLCWPLADYMQGYQWHSGPELILPGVIVGLIGGAKGSSQMGLPQTYLPRDSIHSCLPDSCLGSIVVHHHFPGYLLITFGILVRRNELVDLATVGILIGGIELLRGKATYLMYSPMTR